MPHMIAADITRQICIGLDYAHTLHGPDGVGAGDRPPGHLAHEHHAGVQRHGEDPRLRHRARGRVRRGGGEEGPHQGQGQLPVARADLRAPVRPPRRHVRAGRRVPRDVDGTAAFPVEERHGQDARAAGGADPAAVGDRREHPARAGPHRHEARWRSIRRALPEHGGHGGRPRAHADRGALLQPRAGEDAARALHAERRAAGRRRRPSAGRASTPSPARPRRPSHAAADGTAVTAPTPPRREDSSRLDGVLRAERSRLQRVRWRGPRQGRRAGRRPSWCGRRRRRARAGSYLPRCCEAACAASPPTAS